MERNPWKLATIGLALVGTTALGTGLTTAYVLRQPADTPSVTASAPRTVVTPRAVAPTPAVERPASTAVVPRVTPAVTTPVATSPTVGADCGTGKDRAMKIAKPGVIGGLVGAGLGAAGGAVANGGHGAGKGALIGGLAGTVLGGGYGVYQTNNECGTIFGNAAPAATPVAYGR
jgi:hypothetical protein